jgi:hypothetical protein
MNKEQYKTHFRQALHTITESHKSDHSKNVAQGHQGADSDDLLRAIGDSPTHKSVSALFHSDGWDRKLLHDFTKNDMAQFSRPEQIAIATGADMTHLHPDYDAEKHGKGRAVIGIENLAEE